MKRICLSLFLFVTACFVLAEPPVRPNTPETHPGGFLRIETGTHVGSIRRISADAKGTLVLTCSDDQTARLWRRKDGQLLRTFRPPLRGGREGSLYSCALSPDGAFAAVSGICPEAPEEFMTWTKDSRGNSILIPVGRHEQRNFVFVYSTATGRPVARLEGTLRNVTDLAFSANGSYLACTGGGLGLRVWNAATWEEIGRDEKYNDEDSYGLDWYGDDKLVSTCLDGRVRLYEVKENALRLLKAATVRNGKQPYSARFSPNGREIAVGFADLPAVAILDAETLERHAEPDMSGIKNGELPVVVWSGDGQTLYATGRAYRSKGGSGQNGAILRRWREKGRGAVEDFVLSVMPIDDLRCLSTGRVIFGGAMGTWGEIYPDGTEKTLSGSPLADFESCATDFRLPDGNIVNFPIQKLRVTHDAEVIAAPFTSFQLVSNPSNPWKLNPDGVCGFTFSVRERRFDLIENSTPLPGLLEPDTTSLKITQWKTSGSNKPKLDGVPLRPPLQPHEFAKSLAISPSKKYFFLGTGWNLYKYAASGDNRPWPTPTPVPGVLALNVSGDDLKVVTACGDSTIRWYNAKTGAEILRLIPIPFGQRWVLTTPEGFYDCSPGSDALLGWFFNNAEFSGGYFFPLSCFRQVFHRPGVISRVLQDLDIRKSLQEDDLERKAPPTKFGAITELVNTMVPPQIELITGGAISEVTIPAGKTSLTIQYKLITPIKDIYTRFDVSARYCGRPAATLGKVQQDGAVRTRTIEIPAGMAGELTLHSRNQYVFSDPAVLRVKRSPEENLITKPPRLHVLSVGVGYTEESGEPPLKLAGSDAQKAADLFSKRRGAALGEGLVITLPTLPKAIAGEQVTEEAAMAAAKQVTTAAIKKGLESLSANSAAGDVAIIYITTHGLSTRGEDYSLLTYDSRIHGAELGALLERIPARTLLILDTCHAAAAFRGKQQNEILSQVEDLNQFVSDLSTAELGTAVISSCGGDEKAYADKVTGSYLLQTIEEFLKIRTTARQLGTKGAVRGCAELQDWVTRRMPERVKNVLDKANKENPKEDPLRPSMPACILPKGVPDFPIAGGHD
jgi:WD40 repeat protein